MAQLFAAIIATQIDIFAIHRLIQADASVWFNWSYILNLNEGGKFFNRVMINFNLSYYLCRSSDFFAPPPFHQIAIVEYPSIVLVAS